MLYKHTLILAVLIRGVYLLGFSSLAMSVDARSIMVAPAVSRAVYTNSRYSLPDAVKHTQPRIKPISILLITHPV